MEEFFKLLHPRPVVLIVAQSRGKVNAMACSWCTPISEEPPTIGVVLARESYTRELILESREFTVNVPSRELLSAVWIAGTKSGRDVDKTKLMNVTLRPGKKVTTPIIEECIGHLECKVMSWYEIGECTLIVGEVLSAYADEDKLYRGNWDVRKAEVLLHLGGSVFVIPSKQVYLATK